MSKFENIEALINKSTQSVNRKMKDEQPPDYIDDDILYLRDIKRIPEIASEKIYANIICFCVNGSMDVMLNGQRCTIEAGEILVCPSSAVVERPMVSPDFKFTMVAFTDNLLRELLRQNMDIWNKAAYIRKAHIVKACSDEDRKIKLEGG